MVNNIIHRCQGRASVHRDLDRAAPPEAGRTFHLAPAWTRDPVWKLVQLQEILAVLLLLLRQGPLFRSVAAVRPTRHLLPRRRRGAAARVHCRFRRMYDDNIRRH